MNVMAYINTFSPLFPRGMSSYLLQHKSCTNYV